MQFAGIISILSFKYSILNDKVKKLKQWNESAGNIFIHPAYPSSINGTSETLRNETVNLFSFSQHMYYILQLNKLYSKMVTMEVEKKDSVKAVPVHIPEHLKPNNDEEFGHYLAGLIDGAGHFSSKQQLVIVFHSLDVSLAYYIKERLGFGSINQVKNKNAYLLIITAKRV